MKKQVISILLLILRILLTSGALVLGMWLLWRYEYFSQFDQVDNIIGVIPMVLVLVFSSAFIGLIWIKHSKRYAVLSVSLAVLVGLASAFFPNSLRGNWWIQQPYSTDGDNPDITVYAPFKGEKTSQLDEPATLTLTENLPVMDGALALYPVYASIAQAVYDKTAYGDGESTPFTNTLRAFNSLIAGERDIIFSSHASKKQIQAAKDAGVELVHTPIGKEAFVFLVGDKNPIENLSSQQIYNIYSGKTAKWRTLGWNEGGNIIAFQRPEGSGSQTGIQTIMHNAGLPLIVAQPLPDKSLVGTNSLMKQISLEWKGVQPALGYSYKFFATQMYPNSEVKLLSIDGVEPSAENIASGAYPFTVEFYAITNGVPTGNTKILLDWILSPQGQTLIEKVGYASINSNSTEI